MRPSLLVAPAIASLVASAATVGAGDLAHFAERGGGYSAEGLAGSHDPRWRVADDGEAAPADGARPRKWGRPLTPIYNPPNSIASSVKIIPPEPDTNGAPALVVERESSYKNVAAGQSNATAYFLTNADVDSPYAFTDGIDSELYITSTGEHSGGGFVEGGRIACHEGPNVNGGVGCYGLVTLASALGNAKIKNVNVGHESEVDVNLADAPVPGAVNVSNINVSFIASSGLGYPGLHVADAAYMTNANSISGFQAGYDCPKDRDSAQNVIKWSCFYAGGKSRYGVDIGDGVYTHGQIRGVNYSVDPIGNSFGKSFTATSAPAPTYNAGQVSYSGVTTTDTRKCGNLGVGCVQIGANGALHWMPFF